MQFSENEFRQFLKCKRLYSYQKDFNFSHIEIKILQDIFTRVSSLYLKNSHYSLDNLYNDCITVLNKHNKTLSFLESQYETVLNSLILYSNQLFKYFNINNYYPVFGPVYLNKSISNSIVKLKISGIFRSKNQTLHLVFFSPFTKRIDILNDPILHFTSEEFFQFVKSHKSNRAKVIVHIFYYKDYAEIGYINYNPKNKKQNYQSLVQDIESQNYFPVTPCPYKCKFKNKCEGENHV